MVEADFLAAGHDADKWPTPDCPEIALVGRSNVGKSSLLGVLMGRPKLVRVSRTPGRTQALLFFECTILQAGEKRRIRFVDLPGFGYAKVAKSERAAWFTWMQDYLGDRQSLVAALLLADIRRGFAAEETDLWQWLSARLPVIPILTKVDELPKHQRKTTLLAAKKQLGSTPILTSVNEGLGMQDVWRKLAVQLTHDRSQGNTQ